MNAKIHEIIKLPTARIAPKPYEQQAKHVPAGEKFCRYKTVSIQKNYLHLCFTSMLYNRNSVTIVSKQQIEDVDISASLAEVWRVLTDKEREVLRRNSRIQHFKRNELIYVEEDEPKDMMCLLHGKVKIFKEGVGGRSQIIRMIKPIQYFGYRAFFAQEDYLTNASAFEASTVCLIPMNIVTDLLKGNINLAMFFIRQLSVDLGIADERTVNLTQKHIRGRLAESLLFLKDSYGLEEDSATLSIYLAREDLASLSNMTTSNAIRTLSTFATERIIALDGRKIKLIDIDRLKKISKLG
jgi:CRP-like cAMP-binding protein